MSIDDLLLLASIIENEKLFKTIRTLIDERSDCILQELNKVIKIEDKENLIKKAKYVMNRDNFEYVSILDDDYPSLLREITDYPLGLFIKGNRKLLNKKHLSIVGTRKPTFDGKKMCDMIVKHISTEDVTIVSGLAFGIDIAAHEAAIKYKVPTISVIPSSVNSPVPRTNINIAKSILKNGGLLISEKPPAYKVKSYSYVQRNRIISGMSDRTLIVEAAIKSGSLTTAKFALEQNRMVFAMPGSITNPVAEGTNMLIKQGACPVTKAEDFYFIDNKKSNKQSTEFNDNPIIEYLSKNGATDYEILVNEVNLDFTEIQVGLMELELEGVISRANNKLYLV